MANAVALCEEMKKLGHTFITGGTDNHSMLWDCRPHGLTGSKVEKVCELAHISINKNAVVGDKSALSPGGVRLGTSTLTTRGMMESDFAIVAGFLDRSVAIAQKIQEEHGRKLVDFKKGLTADNADIMALRKEVQQFATKFEIPGWDVAAMKYKDI